MTREGLRRAVLRSALTALIVAGVALASAAYVWREEIWRTTLDPKQPYQTYRPPPAPNYASASAWAILPPDAFHPGLSGPPADVFFVHPTTFDGGRDWNAPLHDPGADRFLVREALPNFAGPFQRVGRVFAPHYRQASLYAFLTLHEDARDARRFAYGDVRAAFQTYLKRFDTGRPLVLAGVGQGGDLVARLVQDVIRADPMLVRRIAAVYLIDTLVPAEAFTPPLGVCQRRAQGGCVVAWANVAANDERQAQRRLSRALVWSATGELAHLGDRPTLCVNPLTGGQGGDLASEKLNRGAADASGLEWELRPAFLPNQVSAQCEGGLLRVSTPASPSLQPRGSWADRRKAASFNLFWLDTEADAQARVEALLGRRVYGPAAPPIQTTIDVRSAPVHRID